MGKKCIYCCKCVCVFMYMVFCYDYNFDMDLDGRTNGDIALLYPGTTSNNMEF